ncbi:DUF2235 domain-containing protein [Vibrio spartinae]|uniref:T6SS Phospholipase effector Tle1-like catalytic domain-containing protein n=1 Tax=Vibrio spartinae TaxID=1918945 RepID=A0A1N6M5A7_9VIBR|nr:DUF2235 domain-containing protein [Vibrio spartinae]QMV14968.1 hypothetical protein Vspart_02246 [Vibrio spartinae]SIO94633.1 hypothetical protein VSP9026_02358 [Vibrio spartinae]
MAYLIVCCDGTWNGADNRDNGVLAPTNIRQIFNMLPEKNSQHTRYQPGVGTNGLFDKLVGGAFGSGVSQDIIDCYQWIADKYQQGDRLILTGFSRGAFTARSLAGLICRFGIIDLHKYESNKWKNLIETVYDEGYRKKEDKEFLKIHHDITFIEDSNIIFFLGVFDTVGALGVPDDKTIADWFDNPSKYRFHDLHLSDDVMHARHAVSIDEMRGSFSPTLWEEDAVHQHNSMKQLWFPGVHSDIGGGYQNDGLSDISLNWMVDELKEVASDLIWEESMLADVKPNPLSEVHDSYMGLMKVLVTAPRNIPNFETQTNHFHPSAITRHQASPRKQGGYHSTHTFSGEPATLDIYARSPWYWTGIYLERGHNYRFTAKGQWIDGNIPAGPKGCNDGEFHPREIIHMASEVLGLAETAYKWFFGKPRANFIATKRVESSPYFCLMGAIANSNNPGTDGTYCPLRIFEIGEEATLSVKESGYLYCFANDAWGHYDNNHGYVTLTVEKM